MNKIMPVIEMKKEDESLAPTAGAGESDCNAGACDKEIIQKICDAEEQEIDDDDHSLIQVEERIIPCEDEVFNEPQAPRVRPLDPSSTRPSAPEEQAPEEEADPAMGAAENVANEFTPSGEQKKRKYTRKAPMSDKQKQHLEKIRKISLEKRQKLKIQKEEQKKIKEEEKEEERIRKAAERLVEKQKKEALQKEALLKEAKAQAQQEQPRQQGQMFTRQDMESAMFSAISSYEAIRKKEKEEKKKQELADAREAQIRRTLDAAINPQKPVDPWRYLFS